MYCISAASSVDSPLQELLGAILLRDVAQDIAGGGVAGVISQNVFIDWFERQLPREIVNLLLTITN